MSDLHLSFCHNDHFIYITVHTLVSVWLQPQRFHWGFIYADLPRVQSRYTIGKFWQRWIYNRTLNHTLELSVYTKFRWPCKWLVFRLWTKSSCRPKTLEKTISFWTNLPLVLLIQNGSSTIGLRYVVSLIVPIEPL